MAKLVRDLIHRGVLTCKQNSTLGQAAVLLDQHQVHALLVVDRDDRPLGIISDYDLLAGEWLSADPDSLETMRKLTVGELMSYPIDTVDAGMPLKEAAHILIEKDIHRLLVTEKGKPAGFISVSDFVSSVAQQEKVRRECVADVMSDAILVCRENTPIVSAARTMTQAGIRSVLVVDARGKPQGVVSGVDLMPFVENGVDDQKSVRDVMHPALTIELNASLRQAADLMIHNHNHRLVVIDQKDPDSFPLGIISSIDIVAEMARPGSVWQT
jgi:CBS domain-containing protein